jgi:sugar/nucleoside kinase (ribokinase family)
LRARYIGVFGGDVWAARVREALARESVDVLAIEVPEATNRLAVVMVDPSGDRVVYEYRDVRLYCRDRAPVIAAVRQARIALVDATDLDASIAIARAARAAGVLTIVDVDRVEAATADLLAAIDVLVAPEEFVAAFTGTAHLGAGLRAMADEYGSTAAIATRGEGGSLAWAGGREVATPGYQVPIVDTTGAGDAFRAGLCCAWLRQAASAKAAGGSLDFDHILHWANATAALSCRALGAQSGLPHAEEVAALVTRGPEGRSN